MKTPDARERAQELLRETDHCIRANPMPAVLLALGIGFLLGLLTRPTEAAPRREPWQQALDEIRSALASGTKRGRKACAQTSEVLREAVGHAVEKARELDPDPVAKWWRKLWS